MRIHPSDLEHGVNEPDAVQAAEWPLWIEPLDDIVGWHRSDVRHFCVVADKAVVTSRAAQRSDGTLGWVTANCDCATALNPT